MRILQLVQKPQRRGGEVFAFQLSQELRRHGQEVRTLYLYPFEGNGCLPLQEGDEVLAGQEKHLFERLPGVHPQLLRRLRQRIEAYQPEVVQVNGARTVKYGAFARRLAYSRPWRLVYRNIGHPRDWVRGRHYTWFYQTLVMPQLDGIVGVSEVTLQYIRDFYGLSIPMAQISNGIDARALVPTQSRESIRLETQTPPEAPVILFVGSLTAEKRVDRLLRVAAQVRAALPQLQVWLVGDGPLRPVLEQQREQLGLNGQIRFLGVQDQVADYFNAADLFALPSDTEGIPAVILEAGLLGLPAVATQVGGLRECIQDGETGLLIDPTDEAGFAQAVTALLRNPLRRQKMGEQARERVNSLFQMDKIAQQCLEFYQQVLIGSAK